MRKLWWFGALVAGGYALAQLNVAKIKRNPNRYAYARLSQDPVGQTAFIDRPDGTRIRTIVAGKGPTIVLAHGYGISLKEWNVVSELLVGKGYRVIMFDWRGHGQSTIGRDGIEPEVVAGDYKAVLEHYDVRDGILVGHSTGGYLAIATLLTHPETAARLRGLVLFASLAGDAVKDAPQNKAQIPLIQAGIMTWVCTTELLGYPFGASIYGKEPSSAAIQVFLDEFQAQDHQQLIPLLRRLAETSFYGRLHEISLPTVVICGEKDSTTPRWHSETMGREIPNGRNIWVPERGHMLNWEAPETLIEAIGSF